MTIDPFAAPSADGRSAGKVHFVEGGYVMLAYLAHGYPEAVDFELRRIEGDPREAVNPQLGDPIPFGAARRSWDAEADSYGPWQAWNAAGDPVLDAVSGQEAMIGLRRAMHCLWLQSPVVPPEQGMRIRTYRQRVIGDEVTVGVTVRPGRSSILAMVREQLAERLRRNGRCAKCGSTFPQRRGEVEIGGELLWCAARWHGDAPIPEGREAEGGS